MTIIKSAKPIQPHSLHSVIIEMQVDHDGVAGNSVVSCRANTQTYELREVAGVKDGPLGDNLIAYLKAVALSPTSNLHGAIDHARAKGW